MNKQEEFETYQGIEVPAPVLVRVERKDKYGSVPGLDDEELASSEELERQIMRSEWGPVLDLPVNGKQGGFRPDVNEDGIAVGAFGSVDFDRIKPGFDKVRYKAEKLREQLKDLLIMIGIVRQRLPRKRVALTLKYVRMGILDEEHILSFDMWQLAKMYMRARWLQKQIAKLVEASFRKKQERVEAWWAGLARAP